MSTCYGCGAEVGSYGAPHIPARPGGHQGVEYLCSGRTLGRFKASCLHKALVKLKDVCPGCGEAFYSRNDRMCDDCQADLAAGREMRESGVGGTEAEAYWIGHVWNLKLRDHQTRDALVPAIAASMSPVVDRGFRRPASKGIKVHDRLEKSGGSYVVTVHPHQAEACRELLRVIERALAEVYDEGVREGRGAILALARGEMSSADFDGLEVQHG